MNNSAVNKVNKKNNNLSKYNNEKVKTEPEVCIYRAFYHALSLKLVLMSPHEHIELMHLWSNQPYASKYWKMEGKFMDFRKHYEEKLLENRAIFLIAYLQHLPVAQIEIYLVKNSVLDSRRIQVINALSVYNTRNIEEIKINTTATFRS